MLGIVAILLLAVYLVFFFPVVKKPKKEKQINDKTAVQVKKLWQIALDSMRDRKTLRAEKALLAILKVDEKNAAAYNRLGILYAKSQKFSEAIECFEIAQSLDENASSLHNAGLIYLETGEYEKASMAFKQAIELEGDVPTRYIALAKSEEKLGNRKNALEALEQAYALDPSINTLRLILAIHKSAEDEEGIAATNARIEAQIAKSKPKKRPLGSRTAMRRPATTVAKRPISRARPTRKRL
jgi:tetratricopeptide (TPR) repeat protein